MMQKALSFLSGMITGALVGATVAVLLAPASGENLRADMRHRVQSARDEMKRAASERRAELQAQLSDLRKPG